MQISRLDYPMYQKIILEFGTVSNFYQITRKKEMFSKTILSKKINISKEIYLEFISLQLKEKARLIYQNLISQNIKIIPIISKFYPHNFLNLKNPPFAIFVVNDEQNELGRKKKILLYEEELSEFGKKVYQYFYYYIKEKMVILNTDKRKFYIEKEDIFALDYKITDKKRKMIIPINEKKSIFQIKLELTDYLFMIEAKYNYKAKEIIEYLIANGKEILVVPGNIFQKKHYFSNYLIQEGANVILNRNDFNKFI